MKVTRPDYFKKFRCIGSACTDNCCIGWEIDIDPSSMNFYRSVPGEFGSRLSKCISADDPSHFILERERCPFLNAQNLCDIILTLGEEHLCAICAEHPRFYEWLGDQKEAGLGLCCEAAAKLILEQKSPVTFQTFTTQEPTEPCGADPQVISSLLKIRSYFLQILQDRSLPIPSRIARVLYDSEKLQTALESEDFSYLDHFVSNSAKRQPQILPLHPIRSQQWELLDPILSFYEALEPFSPVWINRLQQVHTNLRAVLEACPRFFAVYSDSLYQYENLCVYFLFRYFMKAAFDYDILSKVKMIAVSFLILGVLDTQTWLTNENFSFQHQIEIVKAYSKEIEYSEENLQTLFEAFWENEFFSQTALLSLLSCFLPFSENS